MVKIGEILGEFEESDAGEFKLPPTVIVEGRLAEIKLDLPDENEAHLLNDDSLSPVILTFRGDNGYICLYDHRGQAITEFRHGGYEAYKQVFSSTPCLGSMRVKTGQYLVLADIGTSDIEDGGEGQIIVLSTTSDLDRTEYRVMRGERKDAIHPATRICLAEPRPPKAAREE